jgi:hypothetical protein
VPTYTYETIVAAGRQPRVYEIDQRMADDHLTVHPETGEKIRRIITTDRGIIGGCEPDCGSDCGLPGSGGGCCCDGMCPGH